MVLADNLSSRISLILLAGLSALLLIGGLLLAWPVPAGGLRFFQLPSPAQARSIAEAVEVSPPSARPAVLRALNTGPVGVVLEPGFPPAPRRSRSAHAGDPGYGAYSTALAPRTFRIELRRRGVLRDREDGAYALRLSVRLQSGEVLVMQRRPVAPARNFLARASIGAAAVMLVMLATLTLAIRQTTGPVTALARAVGRFPDARAPDVLPLRGPREIRELSTAFNGLHARIHKLMGERTRILAAVAHDLRTYLTRLRLRVEFIDDPEQKARAEHDLEEMAQLLEDTLLFARDHSGRGEPPRLVDLADELERLVAVRHEMGEAVTLDRRCEGAAARARVSPLAFRRIASNLVDNAVRYGGSAHVTLKRDGDELRVAVADDGPGVPEATLARMTSPFERGEGSRSRTTGGAGLGLAIVQALADAQGARLRLGNRPDGGFLAEVFLPAG